MAERTSFDRNIADIDVGIAVTEGRIEALEDGFKGLESENKNRQREQMQQRRAILYDTLQILRNRRAYALNKPR
jgi:hypothetical protein